MSSELTYPILRCILEYLEANKRIHICSRSKALQKIDKKIPLHIKRLEFIGVSITVNDITIIVHWGENFNNREQVLVDGVFRDWNRVLMPGDVCMKDGESHKLSNTKDLEVRGQTPLELNFYKDKNEARRVPPNIPHSIAMKMVATVLFGGRCSIHVSKLAIQSSMLRLPVGLNFRIRNYVDISANNLNEIRRIVDPQSFPLKSISTIPREPENYYHQIVQTAETLVTWPSDIRFFQEPWHRAVLTFPHKHIKLNTNGSVHEEIISIVQDWLDHPRQHGRTLTVSDLKGGLVKRLYDIKKQFHGRLALISGNNDKRDFAKAVIIPIGTTSELLISSTREEEIKLESIPTGTIQSTIYAELTHPDVMWLYSSRIKEYFGESFIETIFFIFAFIIAVGAIFLVFYDF